MTLAHIVAVVLGASLVFIVLLSALKTVVLPSSGLTGITRFVFATSHRIFVRPDRNPFAARLRPLYAPVALVSLPFAWMMIVTAGFTLVFWGCGAGTWSDSFVTSGSSLFTLGFAKPASDGLVLLTFVEATLGLGLVALLISYLPTIYGAFSAREKGVGLLRPLMGSPPSVLELLRRLQNTEMLDAPELWEKTSNWFVDLEQSHAAFPALTSFPSQAESWVSTAGTMLDAAALLVAAIGTDHTPPTGVRMMLAHGIPSLTNVALAAGLPVEPPRPLVALSVATAPKAAAISISRAEFLDVLAGVRALGMATDRDPADDDRVWLRFKTIRASYDDALCDLAGLTLAPSAPWSTDRPSIVGRPHFLGRQPVRATRPPQPG